MTHCTKHAPRFNSGAARQVGPPPPMYISRSDATPSLPDGHPGAAGSGDGHQKLNSTALGWSYPAPRSTPSPGVPPSYASHDWSSFTKSVYSGGGGGSASEGTPIPSPSEDPVHLLKSLESSQQDNNRSASRLEGQGVSISNSPSPSLLVRTTHASDAYPLYEKSVYVAARTGQPKPVKTKSDVEITFSKATPHQYESMLERQFQWREPDRSSSPSAQVAEAKKRLGRTQFALGTDATAYVTVSEKPIEITRPTIKNKPAPVIPGNKFSVLTAADARPAQETIAEVARLRTQSSIPFEQPVLDSADLAGRAGAKRTTTLESMPAYDQRRRPGIGRSGTSAVSFGQDSGTWCTTHQDQFPGIYFKPQAAGAQK